ncbi:MAG: imm11 family protein [Gammaproteobacteria bacterium]
MYYQMDWRVEEKDTELDLADLDVIPDTDVPWTMGIYWDEPVDQPIELEIDTESGSTMPDAFFIGIPLFSERLLNILTSVGVDNIQTYDVVVTDSRNSKTYNNYKAVNIVGLLSCANLEKSRYIKGSGPPLMFFEHLVINQDMINDFSMFRLGEAAGTILVSEKIALNIMENKLIGIRLMQVDSE